MEKHRELILNSSLSQESVRTREILKEHGIEFTEIITDDGSKSPVLSASDRNYTFRGLKNISIFIKKLGSK